MKIHKYIPFLAILSLLVPFNALSQGIFFDPSPTDVTAPARLYVDITSSDCACPELLDADSVTNPLYIWTWNPNEQRAPVNGEVVTNGDWTNSNENLKMTQDPNNPDLWYFDFLGVSVVEFYDVAAATFYSTGINFLVKEKSGAAGDSGAEQKSPDLAIIPEPVGCFEKICPFPVTFFQDEYFVITYDNNKETNTNLQNLGPGEAIISYRYSVNGGPLTPLSGSDEKFILDYDGDGVFSINMIPQDYFSVNPGDQITQIQVLITKPPFNAPPFTVPITLIPGCSE